MHYVLHQMSHRMLHLMLHQMPHQMPHQMSHQMPTDRLRTFARAGDCQRQRGAAGGVGAGGPLPAQRGEEEVSEEGIGRRGAAPTHPGRGPRAPRQGLGFPPRTSQQHNAGPGIWPSGGSIAGVKRTSEFAQEFE